VIVAVLGAAAILAVAVALIWVLAPHEDEPIDPTSVIPTTPVTVTTAPATSTSSTAPG
jgi:hypothetical protein